MKEVDFTFRWQPGSLTTAKRYASLQPILKHDGHLTELNRDATAKAIFVQFDDQWHLDDIKR